MTTTEAQQATEAVTGDAVHYMQVQIPGLPYSVARIPWDADIDWYVQRMVLLAEAVMTAFDGPAAPEEPPAPPPPRPPARPPTAGRNGPPSGPASRPPARGGPPAQQAAAPQPPNFPNDFCDMCGGPPELEPRRQARNGNWVSASLRCAGRCKDKGRYPHTIRWLDDAEMDALGI